MNDVKIILPGSLCLTAIFNFLSYEPAGYMIWQPHQSESHACMLVTDLIICSTVGRCLLQPWHCRFGHFTNKNRRMKWNKISVLVMLASLATRCYIYSSWFVQSKGSHSRAKSATACFWVSTDSCFRRRYISSSGSCSMPLMTLRPRLLLNCFSSSITCTKPLFRPNSTWKYGKSFGIEPRNPFSLVSISLFALCWLHSSSASSIAWKKK